MNSVLNTLKGHEISIGKENDSYIYVISDYGFMINDRLVPKGSIIIAEKREQIYKGEIGIAISGNQEPIRVVVAHRDICSDPEELTILGVAILIVNMDDGISLIFSDNTWKDVSGSFAEYSMNSNRLEHDLLYK